MSATPRTHRRRSEQVKSAILDSARRLFMEGGFDETGIREIAAAAEVNPAIVMRHFTTKEQLFLQSIDAAQSLQTLLSGPLDQLGFDVVRVVVRERGGGGQRVFGAIIRASDRPDIRAHLQALIASMFVEPLIERLDHADAPLRAHLFAAQLVGLLSALSVYDDPFLLESDGDDIINRYGRSLQSLLV